jgi:hypothetical protein
MKLIGSTIESIRNEPNLLTLIGLAIGAIGIALAIYFYIKGKPLKFIASASRSFRVISGRSRKIPGLHVLIHGQPVTIITVTRFAFWNTGNRTIDSLDIPPNDPIVITAMRNAHIDDIELLETTKQANQIQIEKQDNQQLFKINFEYLDPGDGGTVNIIHNGNEIDEFILKGSIKGGKVGKTWSEEESITAPVGPVGPPVQFSMSGRKYLRVVAYVFLSLSPISFVAYFLTQDKDLLFGSGFCLFVGVIALAFINRYYPPSKITTFDTDL